MRRWPGVHGELSFTELMTLSRADPERAYAYAHSYFWQRAPQIVRDHRAWFRQEGRGFGEDAFHAMWWLLMCERHPARMLEIGVYRGQTLSLWALLAQTLGQQVFVSGVSPLTASGDEVSAYADLDYAADVAANFGHFGVAAPSITRAYSTDEVGLEAIRRGLWDVIFVDGGHDCDVVLSDYRAAREGLAPSGLLVFDDAALYLPYRARLGATEGHAGPSGVVRDFVQKEMRLVGNIGHDVIFAEHDE